MVKFALTTAFVCVLSLSGDCSTLKADSFSNKAVYTSFGQALETNKQKKNNQLPNELQDILKPVTQLKRAIEAELPQKELTTIKRIAFKVLIIARKFI